MKGSFAGDIEISFKGMACYRNRCWISCGNSVPIQINSCNLNLFDIYEQRVSRETVAHLRVEDCDDQEHDHQYCSGHPRCCAAGEIAEGQSEQYTADENYPPCGPILTADLIEDLGPASQPLDLLVQLLQTSHARVTITRLVARSQKAF